MTPLPDTVITVIHISAEGEVTVNTNVSNHKVLITHSEREFDRLANYAFNPAPGKAESLKEDFYKPVIV